MSKKLEKLKKMLVDAQKVGIDYKKQYEDSNMDKLYNYQSGCCDAFDWVLHNVEKLTKEPKPKKQKIRKHQIWECKATARYIEVNEIDKSVPNFKRIYYNYTGNEKQFNINTTGFYNKFRFIKDVKKEN